MKRKLQAGFTLIEAMVTMIILLAVSGIVMSGMVQMMRSQGTISNRTEMHTSVRSATELLQQEIGQAGKISLPVPPAGVTWAMTSGVAVPKDTPVTNPLTTFNVVNAAGNAVLFEGERVTVDTGLNKETVQLTCAAGKGNCPGPSNIWSATFYYTHTPVALPGGTIGVPISLPGAFSTGIVPPAAGVMAAPPPGYAGYPVWPVNAPAQGSSGTVLKLYGDVNGDGEMVYIEYTCVQGTQANPGFVYRNQVPFFDSAVVPPLDPSKIILTGVLTNPADQKGNPVPCFNYQLQTKEGANAALNDMAFVTDVAVTLTVQTQNRDVQTQQFQQETKALLNVSPRNVYEAYQFASFDYTNRVQPTPMVIKNTILPNYP